MAKIIDGNGETHERLWVIDGVLFDLDAAGTLCQLLEGGALGPPSTEVIDLERIGWKRADILAISV